MHAQREQLQARARALHEATIAMTGEALWRANATNATNVNSEIVTQYTPKASSDAAAAIATAAAMAASITAVPRKSAHLQHWAVSLPASDSVPPAQSGGGGVA